MAGGFQSGKVFQPYFNDQGVAFIQVAGASQQQESIMHQCSPLLVCEAFANFFTDSFQASREQLEHVKLVYNQFGMWQNLMYRIMVASPYIRTHDGDMLFYGIGQALQVTDHRGFGALSKQVNDLVVGNIGDHTSVLMQQIQFVALSRCCPTLLESEYFTEFHAVSRLAKLLPGHTGRTTLSERSD